jgi:uncharacterized spore protein YtfJ
MPGVDAIRSAFDGLFEALSVQLIVEPIELEDKIIIPITKMGMGFGTDIDQSGPDADQEGMAGRKAGAGGGAGIFPIAVVIVFKGISGPEGVKVVALPQPGESISDIAQVLIETIMSYKNIREKRTDNIAAIKVE